MDQKLKSPGPGGRWREGYRSPWHLRPEGHGLPRSYRRQVRRVHHTDTCFLTPNMGWLATSSTAEFYVLLRQTSADAQEAPPGTQVSPRPSSEARRLPPV